MHIEITGQEQVLLLKVVEKYYTNLRAEIGVLPFVPIKGVAMADCVQLARRAGERIARELQVPVFLYEQAATRPDRANLADVRRGEFEGLREEIETNPNRKPDFGEARI